MSWRVEGSLNPAPEQHMSEGPFFIQFNYFMFAGYSSNRIASGWSVIRQKFDFRAQRQ
jgi:hypothetical protein